MIVLSARRAEGELDAAEVLPKPFDLKELISIVGRALYEGTLKLKDAVKALA